MNETGFYDVKGIPIHVGDLIRVKHFRHYRCGRQMWLYFRVAQHPSGGQKYVVQNWHDQNPANWQCLLTDCGIKSAEVLASGDVERGSLTTFNERKRRRVDQAR